MHKDIEPGRHSLSLPQPLLNLTPVNLFVSYPDSRLTIHVKLSAAYHTSHTLASPPTSLIYQRGSKKVIYTLRPLSHTFLATSHHKQNEVKLRQAATRN